MEWLKNDFNLMHYENFKISKATKKNKSFYASKMYICLNYFLGIFKNVLAPWYEIGNPKICKF
jgi:hypothetical protein